MPRQNSVTAAHNGIRPGALFRSLIGIRVRSVVSRSSIHGITPKKYELWAHLPAPMLTLCEI